MAFAVVLDTCVLYPAILCDTLLRLAERGLYRPLWSAHILEELQRVLIEAGIEPDAVEYRIGEMRRAFLDAEVTGYDSLIEAMTCDTKDRHVLAAAVRSDAAAIITFNLKDFPAHSLEPFAIDAIHPDAFLLDTLDLYTDDVLDELELQANAYTWGPMTPPLLIDALEQTAPSFAEELRQYLETDP